MVELKRCLQCREEKPLTEFHLHKGGRQGLRARCKVCYNATVKSKHWNEAGEYRRRKYDDTRNAHYMFRYGLTLEEVEAWRERVGHICQICGDKTEKLFVDHCHRTGKVRDLLCRSCNFALGWIDDNPELLGKLVEYLKRHE